MIVPVILGVRILHHIAENLFWEQDNLSQLGINRFGHRVNFAVQIIALDHAPHFRPNFVSPQKKI